MLSKLPLMLVSDAGYGSHRRQNRRRHRCYDLHNPLKSFLLRHNRLIDFNLILVKPTHPVTPLRRAASRITYA